MIFKKSYLAFTLCALMVLSVPSKAFFPLFLGLTMTEEIALGVSIALHGALLAVTFKNSPTDTATTSPLIVNLSPKAKTVSSVPAGWAAAANGYGLPTPPPSILTSTKYTPDGSTWYIASGYQDACSQWAASQTTYPSGIWSGDWFTGPYGLQCYLYNTLLKTSDGKPSIQNHLQMGTASSCPTGYTISGANCINPTSEVKMPADNQKIITRSANAFVLPTQDPDPLPTNTTMPDDSTVKVTNTDGTYGQVKLNTDGTATVTQTSNVGTVGQVQTDTYNMSAPDPTTGAVGVNSVASITSNPYNATPAVGTSAEKSYNDTATALNNILNKKTDCELNPSAAGCASLGTPTDGGTLTTKNISVIVSPISVGDEVGSCPADKIIVTTLGTFSLPYTGICSFAISARPILLAFAWFSAALLLIGAARKGG